MHSDISFDIESDPSSAGASSVSTLVRGFRLLFNGYFLNIRVDNVLSPMMVSQSPALPSWAISRRPLSGRPTRPTALLHEIFPGKWVSARVDVELASRMPNGSP